MRWVVDGKAASDAAASQSRVGRSDTRWLTAQRNLAALIELSAQCIDRVHSRRLPRGIMLLMDQSVSPTDGEQEMSVWNGRYFAFQRAEVTVLRMLFAEILSPIAEPGPPPNPARA